MIDEKKIVAMVEESGRFTRLFSRVYKKGEVIAQFNDMGVSEHREYVDCYFDKVLAIDKPVGIVYTDEGSFFIVLKVEDYIVVTGPASEYAPSRKQVEKIAAMMECNEEEAAFIFNASQSVDYLSVGTALMMACTKYHLLTGIRLRPSEILKDKKKDGEDKRDAGEDKNRDQAKKWKSYCELDERMAYHDAVFQRERKLCHALSLGSEAEVERVLQEAKLAVPQRGADRLENLKVTFVISATVASRTVIQCGVSPAESFGLVEYYVTRAERMTKVEQFHPLMLTMLKHFAVLVRDIVKSVRFSNFVADVNGYIELHITEKIMVEDMAHDLGMSRNSLSGRFKQETGELLSDYIMMKKVERAKFLIGNTDQSISEISAYLDFSSQSHFQRVFKKYTGITPNEYRKRDNHF